MAEYAGEGRLTNSIRFSQELISSVPSIVVGLFGLAAVRQRDGLELHGAGGALALTVFNLPLMARLAEQAIRAVSRTTSATAASPSGATKWQTIRHVVLPLAIPGIVTGIILTAGRIFGEAAALLFTAGLSTPTHYDFGELQPDRPALAVEPVPPGDDAVGLHLEDQLRGPRRLRPPDRRRDVGGPVVHGPRLQPRRPRSSAACSSAGVTADAEDDHP